MKPFILFALAFLLNLAGVTLAIVRLSTYPDHALTGLAPTFTGLGALLVILAINRSNREDPS